MNKSELQNLKEIKGNCIVAEFEISYKSIITNRTTITTSAVAYELVKSLWNAEAICLQEDFAALFFNTSKK